MPTSSKDAEHAGVVAALVAAQGEFPTINKTQTAEVRTKDGGKYTYSYADLGDVLGQIRPVLSKHGLAIVQQTKPDENGKTLLHTRLMHASGDELESVVELGQSPGNPQAFGGALTYLRRYELVTLLGIAAEEDRDAQDVPPANGQRPPELPSWARAAGRDRMAGLEPLGVVLGAGRAGAFVRAIRDGLGGTMPAGVAAALTALAGQYHEALAELGYLDAIKAERQVADEAEQKAVEAAAAAAEQDAAAEAPDVPSEEPEGHSGDDAADEYPSAADDDEGIDHQAKPAAGSVEPPAIGDDTPPLEVEQAFRDAGCTCQDPGAATLYEVLAAQEGKDEQAAKVKALVDDDCPIRGHGIGF
jgi:hypothetical protein